MNAEKRVQKVRHDLYHGVVSVIGLSAEEIGVYVIICMLVAADQHPITRDDHRFSVFSGLSRTRRNRIIDRLIALNRLTGDAGRIWVNDSPMDAIFDLRPSRDEWASLREEVFKRDGFRCVYCGRSDLPLECDHVHPVSRGGSNDLSNLAAACKPCNRSKSAKTVEEWLS